MGLEAGIKAVFRRLALRRIALPHLPIRHPLHDFESRHVLLAHRNDPFVCFDLLDKESQ
ncbi:MAG TPA: hypothetical protein VFW53_08760 [Gallionella sp.]|nr:hypothetical protein [Gallionella sp.]